MIFRFSHQFFFEQFFRFFVEFESFFDIHSEAVAVFMHQPELPMGIGLTTSRC